MIMPDVIIIGLIMISILIGVLRGFIKELISLITWGVAITLAALFTTPLSAVFTFTQHAMVRMVSAFLFIFVGTIFAGAIVNALVGSVVRHTPFSVPDRILGSCFGLLRGFALVTLLVLLGGLTPFPQSEWWKGSFLIGEFTDGAAWLQSQLPQEHAQSFKLAVKTDNKEK